MISLIVFVAGALTLWASLSTSGPEPWSFYAWPALWLFVAWRFFRFGLYTSPWGVRICNPVLTWWYSWNEIDRFELGSTGEMFSPRAQAPILVTQSGARRTIWSLATSAMFFRLTDAAQAEVLEELNRHTAIPSREGQP